MLKYSCVKTLRGGVMRSKNCPEFISGLLSLPKKRGRGWCERLLAAYEGSLGISGKNGIFSLDSGVSLR